MGRSALQSSWPAYFPSTPIGSQDVSRASSNEQRSWRNPSLLRRSPPMPYHHQVRRFLNHFPCCVVIVILVGRPITLSISAPVSLYASRASLARRRTALRMAVRARWDQFKLWRASGRFSEMQRRVRAALPGRERVYQYVGLDGRGDDVSSEQGVELVREDVSSTALS